MAMVLTSCSTPWAGTPPLRAGGCLDGLDDPAPVTGVFVEPDDGYPPVLDELSGARCTIDLTIYMLTDDTVFDALISARERGVRVRVILDQHPFGMFGDQQEARDRLEDAGIEVQWGLSRFQFTHAKFIVVDERVALVMNQNLTYSAFNGNREFGVVTTDQAIVAQALAIFENDWSGDGERVPSGPLLVSPVTSRSGITRLILEAESSIDFYAEVIRDDGVIAALRDAVARGVRVRLIVNASVDPDDLERLAELSAIGVDVRMSEQIYIHAKAMIVDDESALIGSQNYTMTSLDRNREVGLVVTDPSLVMRVASVFERDWVRSVPASTVSGASMPDPSPLLRTFGVEYPDTPLDNVSVVRI